MCWLKIYITVVYIGGSQSVLRGSQGMHNQFPGDPRYISVMAALKFTYLLIK